MLQRRSVEHHLGATLTENLQQIIALTNISQNNAVIVQARLVSNRNLRLHQQSLIMIKHHEGLRLKLANLTAQLRTNRTARTRNQHTLTVQVRTQNIAVNIVVNLTTNHAHQVVIARGNQTLTHQSSIRATNTLNLNLKLTHAVAEGLEVILRHIRNRHQNLTGTRLTNHLLQLAVSRNHRNAVELRTSLQLVIIEDRNRAKLRILIVQHRIHDHAADKASTVHNHRLTGQLTHSTALSVDALRHAGARHHNQAKCRRNRRHTMRNMRQTQQLIHKGESSQRRTRAQSSRAGTPRLVKRTVRIHAVINLHARQTNDQVQNHSQRSGHRQRRRVNNIEHRTVTEQHTIAEHVRKQNRQNPGTRINQRLRNQPPRLTLIQAVHQHRARVTLRHHRAALSCLLHHHMSVRFQLSHYMPPSDAVPEEREEARAVKDDNARNAERRACSGTKRYTLRTAIF